MSITIRETRAHEIEELIPILLQAEPVESALRWSLSHLSDTIYRMEDNGDLVGAATMRWQREPCELIELAITQERHGQGLGRQLVDWLLDEARRRGKTEIFVGTGNASPGNFIFYQRCGFRMDHIRQDYFWYFPEPIFEHGIPVRDMLVFRYDLTGPSDKQP